MTIGEVKARFSEVLESVRRGKTVIISYGRKREKVAALVPYRRAAASPRPLGLLRGKARCRIAKDFSVTDEQLLGE
ncbi:MAG: prevent-host-death protein [Betaproteobacteria bacterium]|nr:prevent-host-death protein [Betaproteobacteria bacterium]